MYNIHPRTRTNYYNQPALDLPEFKGTPSFYIVCSTERSGSTLLCDILRTNQIGVPHEYFHPSQHFPFLARRFGVIPTESSDSIENYTRQILKFRTTQNGWFGTKMHFSHLSWLTEIIPVGDLFPNARYVVIDRKDIVAQAVSHIIAGQTGVWYGHGEPRSQPLYDFSLIARQVKLLQKSKNQWLKLFESNHIDPINILYEDLVKNPENICRELQLYLSLDQALEYKPKDIHVTKTGGEINRKWVARFKKDISLQNP